MHNFIWFLCISRYCTMVLIRAECNVHAVASLFVWVPNWKPMKINMLMRCVHVQLPTWSAISVILSKNPGKIKKTFKWSQWFWDWPLNRPENEPLLQASNSVLHCVSEVQPELINKQFSPLCLLFHALIITIPHFRGVVVRIHMYTEYTHLWREGFSVHLPNYSSVLEKVLRSWKKQDCNLKYSITSKRCALKISPKAAFYRCSWCKWSSF